jgi:RNA polymerase sigma factor (sigma-70 family)
MTAGPVRLLRHLRRLVARPADDPAGDGALLRRYVVRRDEDAFAALVERHGPMVLRVCRRVLADGHAAEDAFQATFLVLARKAALVNPPDALAAWLHGVAYRVALKARSASARRPLHQMPPDLHPHDPHPDPLAEVTARELLAVLDEELRRLPTPYRLPLILCCLEGRSQEEAARQLGWTPGSLKGRLERGRARLHARLARRGFTLSAALAAVSVSRGMAATVPAALAAVTVRQAVAWAAGGNLAGAGLADGVRVLVHEAGKETGRWKLKALAVLALLVTVAVGATVWLRLGPPGDVPQAGEPERPGPEGRPAPLPEKPAGRFGLRDTLGGGHSWGVGAIAYRPDGQVLASTDDEGVKLWDVVTGRNIAYLRGQKEPVSRVAFSPDGKTVAAATITYEQTDNGPRPSGWEVRLWDAAAGKSTVTLKGSPWPLFSLAFSPDGKLLATATGGWHDKKGRDGGDLRLWSTDTGKEIAALPGHATPLHLVAFTPDGKTLLSWSRQGVLEQWDAATLKNKGTTKLERAGGLYAAFSPDGKTLAVGDCVYKDGLRDSGVVQLWDVDGGKRTATLLGHKDVVLALAFSPDSKTLASGSLDQSTIVWDLGTGKPTLTLAGESGRVTCLAFSPDGKTLASSSGDTGLLGDIAFWDLKTGNQTATLGGHTVQIFAVAFRPDGKGLVTGGNDKTVRLWELPTGKVTQTLRPHQQAVYAVAVSPDGKTLASGSEDLTVKLWDLAAGKVRATLEGHASGVRAVAFSPDGSVLASANGGIVWKRDEPVNEPGVVYLWDPRTGKKLAALRGHTFGVTSLAFSPDGKTLAWCSSDQWHVATQKYPGEIKLWDVAAAKEVATLPSSGHRVAFCAGGKVLASGVGATVTLWDVGMRKQTATLEGHTGGIAALACSPDGKLLASASGPWGGDPNRHPGMIKIWDVATAKEAATLEGHVEQINGLAFSPDGKTLASCSGDRTIKLWDIPSSADGGR